MKLKNKQQIFEYKEHAVEPGVTVPLLHFKQLEEVAGITHCFTTRGGGVSENEFATMNFSVVRGDKEEAVLENYRRISLALGTEIGQFVCTDQTHTTNVRKVTKADAGKGVVRSKDYTDVDGLITNEPGLVLSTFYADCVPLYFVDPVHKAIGLSHSGWRGTVNKMGQVTIEAMQKEYGSRPEDLYCAIGPSICQDCYEVSRDVAEEFQKAFPGHEEKILWQKSEEKFQLDLWKANEIVMLEAGILSEHLAVTNICTCCNHEELFSHRASKGKRGNLAAFLMLNA
ncbi:MAG: peptidoglycan editing factor PgeF [Roseburia sp.]|nr:peptidoglycan editing factor PgeF [Roseburia sp.]